MLHDLQRDFAAVALADDIAALVSKVRAPRGSRERRLRVYRNNTVKSLTDVLAAAFPVVERIVGTRFFRATARTFIEKHPPLQPALFQYGRDLPSFLETFEPARDLPYLPDVARLEWARNDSYFAANQDSLNPEDLAQVPADRLESVVFTLHPAVRLIQSPFPVFEIWTVNQPDYGPIPELDFSVGETGLVQRHGAFVTHKVLSQPAYEWLTYVCEGATLGHASNTILAHHPTFDLQDTLRAFLADGVIAALRFEP